MIYSYQQKNKLKHLLLDNDIVRAKNGYPATIQRYQEQRNWIKENIGGHNLYWAVNYGFIHNGQKVYQKDFDSQKFRKTMKTKYVVQWCFENKIDAMAFRLRWM